MRDEQTYKIIKEVTDHGGNRHRAALILGCSKRSVDRHVAGYKAHGKAYFVHGNSGRTPVHALDEAVKQDISDLYLGKYPNANFAHFTQLLQERDKLSVSESSIRKILKQRLKQAGMRWNPLTAQYLLTLRAKYKSKLWLQEVERPSLKFLRENENFHP